MADYQFSITVKGKGCHGAQPEAGIDAVVVTAAMINNLQSIVSREISPVDPAVITVGTIQAGSRWNVVAEETDLMVRHVALVTMYGINFRSDWTE